MLLPSSPVTLSFKGDPGEFATKVASAVALQPVRSYMDPPRLVGTVIGDEIRVHIRYPAKYIGAAFRGTIDRGRREVRGAIHPPGMSWIFVFAALALAVIVPDAWKAYKAGSPTALTSIAVYGVLLAGGAWLFCWSYWFLGHPARIDLLAELRHLPGVAAAHSGTSNDKVTDGA